MSMLDAALELADKGFSVFQVTADKRPLTAHGCKDATSDRSMSKEWWTRNPFANVALATGETVVLDVDFRHSGDISLAALEAEYACLPETLESKTGGGGRHLFFAAEGANIRNSTGKLGAGLDIRGTGGYVVAPPSVHESGLQYKWVSNILPAPLPLWLKGLLTPRHRQQSQLGTNRHSRIYSGGRNATLTSLAGTMRKRGMSYAAVLAALLEQNRDACDPPLNDSEVRLIAQSVSRYQPAPSGGSALPTVDSSAPLFSEEFLALEFSDRYATDLRYVSSWGRWMRWNGCRWEMDDTLAVYDLARAICRMAATEWAAEKPSAASRLASAATVAAVERLARADRRHAAKIEQWDADPWLLNTPRGTVELRIGNLRAHRRDDYITKLTAVGPAGESSSCDLWLEFLDRVTDHDVELQQFLQRMFGYALTASTREHALFFFHGGGANGKTVFVSTVGGILGDYAKIASTSTFTANNAEQHPTDLAGLRGARLVIATETEQGSRWAEAKIKALTGGDRIAARFMRQDFFEFVPQFKLIISGNHKPGLSSVDEAIRRRLFLVPFTVTIPPADRDSELCEKLKQEWPAILRWGIEGCLAWQCEGLNPPAVVRAATQQYLDTEDRLAAWLADRCLVGVGCEAPVSDLFSSWRAWCEALNEKPGSAKRFSQALESRGFRPYRTARARLFEGIGLASL